MKIENLCACVINSLPYWMEKEEMKTKIKGKYFKIEKNANKKNQFEN